MPTTEEEEKERKCFRCKTVINDENPKAVENDDGCGKCEDSQYDDSFKTMFKDPDSKGGKIKTKRRRTKRKKTKKRKTKKRRTKKRKTKKRKGHK